MYIGENNDKALLASNRVDRAIVTQEQLCSGCSARKDNKADNFFANSKFSHMVVPE